MKNKLIIANKMLLNSKLHLTLIPELQGMVVRDLKANSAAH